MRIAPRNVQYSGFKAQPIAAACGAVLHDLGARSLQAGVTNGLAGEIKRAVSDHLVVAIPDQDLTSEALSELAGAFGEVCRSQVLDEVDGAPGVVRVVRKPSQEGMPFFAGNWHSDGTFSSTSPRYSLLYAEEVPELVGSTLFSSQQLAFDQLSAGMKTFLEEARVVHSAGPSMKEQHRSVNVEMKESDWDETEHPAVYRDPSTGRCGLFINDAYSIRFAGWTAAESRGLLNFLFNW